MIPFCRNYQIWGGDGSESLSDGVGPGWMPDSRSWLVRPKSPEYRIRCTRTSLPATAFYGFARTGAVTERPLLGGKPRQRLGVHQVNAKVILPRFRLRQHRFLH